MLDVRKGKTGMVYVVEDHGKNRLITRSEMAKNHPMALLAFYEANVKLKDLPGGENIEERGDDDASGEEENSSVEEMEGPRRRYPFRRRK